MATRTDVSARVDSCMKVGPDTFLMRLYAPEIAENAHPGQFVMVRPGHEGEFDPLLRRPFSIHRCFASKGMIELLFRVVGRGTKLMAATQGGCLLQVLGPLGTGFALRRAKIPILVGGGLGVAPLLFLADTLRKGRGVVVVGAVSKGLLLRLDAFAETGLEVLVATEDGSFGNKGLVTEILDRLLSKVEAGSLRDIIVLSCGPMPMLKVVAGICKGYGVECQVSLETSMACGIGLCLGCAIKASSEGYVHVCKDGPVFSASRIDWSQV